VLAGCGALPALFPEFAVTDSREESPAPSAHGNNSLSLPVLDQSVTLSKNTAVRFAAVVCDMDNGATDGLSSDALAALCERHRVPNTCRELAEMALRQREQVHTANALSATELLELLNTLDAFRRTDRFGDFLQVCEADARACHRDFNGVYLRKVLTAAQSVRTDALQKQGLSGREIGEALNRQRITEIEKTTLTSIQKE
jgi:tRNA nucleotidyltransferase (CCA-adding enzyme)